MKRRLIIAGILFSMAACLRAANGQSPSLELQISIARAKAAHVSTVTGGQATKPVVTKAPPVLDWLPADAQPTPMESVVEGLAALRLKPTDIYEDIGCGRDCRWGITAAKRYGCKVIAIEIDPDAAEEAKQFVERNGVAHLVTVIVGDASQITTKANKGSAYLFESDLAPLASKVKGFEKFVTYAHEVPGLSMKPWPFGDVYVYEKPPAMVAKMIYPTSATWGGREYTRAKSGCGCEMCRSLRAQLAPRMVMVPAETAAARTEPAGRWVMQKQCVNGRCTMQRVWQAY